MTINKSLLDRIKNDIINEIEKAGPKTPSVKTPTPQGAKKTIYWQGEGRQFPRKINFDTPIPPGWAETPKQKEDIESKKEKPTKEEEVSPKDVKEVGEDIKTIWDKVQEKLGVKPKETPKQEKPKEAPQEKPVSKPGQDADKKEFAILDDALNYLEDIAERVGAKELADPKLEAARQQLIDTKINKLYSGLKKKLGEDVFKPFIKEGKKETPSLSYDEMKDKVSQYNEKLSAGKGLDKEQFKEYKQLEKQLSSQEDAMIQAMQEENDRKLAQEKANKVAALEKQLKSGDKPYPDKGQPRKEVDLKMTDSDKEKDLEFSAMVRYKDVPIEKVKANNKKVVDKFVELSGIKLPKNSKINYIKGEISFPFNPDTVKNINNQLARQGMTGRKEIQFKPGMAGEDSKITISRMPGVNWEIKSLSDKSLADSVSDISERYADQAKAGQRIQYEFEFAPGVSLTNPPDSPEGQSMLILQGGQRSGKGLTFGSMINQALGSADGSIVKFNTFDSTGAFWNDMKGQNPNVIKDLEAKGLLNHNGVTPEDITKLTGKDQEMAIEKYTNGMVNQFNTVYAERQALRDHYKVGHVGKIKDQQVPQQVFLVDEMQQLENMISDHPTMPRGKKKELIKKVTGMMASQKTNGKKLGITFVGAVQNGFKTKDMQQISGTEGTSLLSLDGDADLGSFGSARGFTNAVKRARIGGAVLVKVKEPDQDPNLLSPILPGNGSVNAMKKQLSTKTSKKGKK